MEISEDAVEDASSRAALRKLSPILKGYLRAGAMICGAPAYDAEFGGGRPGDSGDGEDGRALQTTLRRRGGGADQLMRRVARLAGFLALCLFFLVSVAAAQPSCSAFPDRRGCGSWPGALGFGRGPV